MGTRPVLVAVDLPVKYFLVGGGKPFMLNLSWVRGMVEGKVAKGIFTGSFTQ